MTRLLRSCLLLFALLSAGFAAQAQSCRITLSELISPQACLCGNYSVDFTVSTPLPNPYTAKICPTISATNLTPDCNNPVTSVTASPIPDAQGRYHITVIIPCTLDTSRFYYVSVTNGPTGCQSNIKAITVRPVDRSPAPVVTIAITAPALQTPPGYYCPKDTLTFAVTSLVVANNIPPATYQWIKNGSTIEGQTSDHLRITGLINGDAIWVLVTKGNICALNDTASSNHILPPIKKKPLLAIVKDSGSGCSDSVTLFRLDTMNIEPGDHFQWFRNGVAIAGATGITYVLQPGVANCHDTITAKAYIVNCPDTITTAPLIIQNCGRVRVENVQPRAFCAGDTVRVRYSTLNCFDDGNVFTFQLSDASGSFASPVEAGSVVDSDSGTATVLIPSNLPGGSGYLLRIISSAPVGVSLNNFGPLRIFSRPGEVVPGPNNKRCGPGPITVRVSSDSAISYRWYTAAVGGTRITNPDGSLTIGDSLQILNLVRDTVFYVEAVNANGCVTATRVAVPVLVGQPLNVQAGPAQQGCERGPCFQLIGGSPTGGVWSGIGVNGSAFCPDTLAAGFYTVQYLVIDRFFGCKDSATKQVEIRAVPQPEAGTPDSTVCVPGPPVSFLLRGFSPDTLPYQWTSNPPGAVDQFGNVFLNQLHGIDTLIFTITTAQGCSRFDTRILRSDSGPQVQLTTTPPLLCNTPTGTVTINPFNNSWTVVFINSDGDTVDTHLQVGPIYTGFAAGSYTILVSDGGCVSQQSFVISDLLGPQVSINGLSASYCSSDSCVRLTTTPASGGIVHFSSNPPGAVDSTGLFCPGLAVSGTVSVFVTFKDTLTGCLGADTVTTVVNEVPGANAEPDTTICLNAGIVPLSGGGIWTGTGVVALGSGQGFDSRMGVLVPDSNVLLKTVTTASCSTTIRKIIRVLPSPQPVLDTTGSVALCQSGSLAVSVTIAGISAPLPLAGISIELKNLTTGLGIFDSTGHFTITQAGVYRAYAFGGSCQDSGTATLNVTIDSIGVLSAAPDTSVCRNASFTLRGTPPSGGSLTGVWRGPGVQTDGFTFDASTIATGVTQVNVFYVVSNGTCRDSARKIITLIDAPTASIVAPNTSSCSTPILLTANPTGLGVRYVFFRNDTLLSPPDTTTSPIYTATVSGVYTLLAITGTCSDLSDPVNILISTPPVLPALAPIITCQGVGGGISLTPPTNVTSYVYHTTPPTNPHAVIPLPFNGGYVFNPDSAGPGTHILVLVAINGGCSDSTGRQSITIGRTPTYTVQLDSATDCVTPNGSATITYTGSDTTHWKIGYEGPGTLVRHHIINVPQGTFDFTITDTVTGCVATGSFTIVAPGTFRANIRGVATGYCIEGLPVILPNPIPVDSGVFTLYHAGTPPTVVPGPGGPIIRDLPGGSYYLVYVADSNGCFGRDTAFFSVNSPQTPTIAASRTDTVCQGTPVTLRAVLNGPGSANRTYSWFFDGATTPIVGATADTLNAVDPGTYTVQVDSAGCSRLSGFYRVNVRPAPIANIAIVGTNPACAGDSLTLVSNLARHYQWLRGGVPTGDTLQQLVIRQSGNYSIIVSNGSCSTTSGIQTITFNPLPAAEAGPGGQACVSTPAVAITGFSPALSGTDVRFLENYVNGDQFNPVAAGVGIKEVILSVTANGCTSFDTAYFTVVPGFNVTVSPTAVTICNQTDTLLTPTITPATAGADYSFQWYRNDTLLAGATDSTYRAGIAGSYTVVAMVTNSVDQCSAKSVPTLLNIFPFTQPNGGTSDTVCTNSLPFQLIGSPTGTYSGHGVSPTGQFTPADSVIGRNQIIFTTLQTGCQLRDTIYVTVNPVPVVTASYFNLITQKDNDPIDILDSVELRATGADTYTWGPANAGLVSATGSPVIAKPRLTQQYVVVGSTLGCVASANVTVVVRTDVRVANGFSPNNDGENDFWNIYNIQNYPNADIRVYNRWGALVYKAKGSDMVNFDNYWNGKSDGKDVPVGSYYYTIDLNNNQKPFIGSVTLVR